MPRLPFIPEYITEHLGTPDSDAENVTLPFLDYISNVASSELEHRCCIPNYYFFVYFYSKNVEARDSALQKLQYIEYSKYCIGFFPKRTYNYHRQISTKSKQGEPLCPR